jgi:hypothetical protein
LVAANAGKAVLRTMAAESASIVLLNIFYLLVAPILLLLSAMNAYRSYLFPAHAIKARRIAANVAKLPELLASK